MPGAAGRVRSSDSLSNRRNHEFMLNHAKMGPRRRPSGRERARRRGRGRQTHRSSKFQTPISAATHGDSSTTYVSIDHGWGKRTSCRTSRRNVGLPGTKASPRKVAAQGETVRRPSSHFIIRGKLEGADLHCRQIRREGDNRFTAVVTWGRFAYCVKCACRIPTLAQVPRTAHFSCSLGS